MDFISEMEQVRFHLFPSIVDKQLKNCNVKEPFNATEFIERLAWTALGVSSNSSDEFSANKLLNSFEEAIK